MFDLTISILAALAILAGFSFLITPRLALRSIGIPTNNPKSTVISTKCAKGAPTFRYGEELALNYYYICH